MKQKRERKISARSKSRISKKKREESAGSLEKED